MRESTLVERRAAAQRPAHARVDLRRPAPNVNVASHLRELTHRCLIIGDNLAGRRPLRLVGRLSGVGGFAQAGVPLAVVKNAARPSSTDNQDEHLTAGEEPRRQKHGYGITRLR